MRVDCGAGCGVGAADATAESAAAATSAANATAQRFTEFTALVSRKHGERMAARAARNDDLKVAFFTHASRVARAILVTAESATG